VWKVRYPRGQIAISGPTFSLPASISYSILTIVKSTEYCSAHSFINSNFSQTFILHICASNRHLLQERLSERFPPPSSHYSNRQRHRMSTKGVRSLWPGTTHEDTHFGFLLKDNEFLASRYAWILAWLPTPRLFMEPSSSDPPRNFPQWSELPPELKDAILGFAFPVPPGEELRQITLVKHFYDPTKPDTLWRHPPSSNSFAAGAVLLESSVELVQSFVSKGFLRAALPHLARQTAIAVDGCS